MGAILGTMALGRRHLGVVTGRGRVDRLELNLAE